MIRLFPRYFILILILIFTSLTTIEGQPLGKARGKNPEKTLFGQSRKIKTKSRKTREPKKVTGAKREAEKKELKRKQDYFDYVDKSKKRAFHIQSPAVRARMKQNQKDIADREKERKKKRTSDTRRGAGKYRK